MAIQETFFSPDSSVGALANVALVDVDFDVRHRCEDTLVHLAALFSTCSCPIKGKDFPVSSEHFAHGLAIMRVPDLAAKSCKALKRWCKQIEGGGRAAPQSTSLQPRH